MTIAEKIAHGMLMLKETSNPRLDTELILAWVLGQDRLYLMMYPDRLLTPKEEVVADEWLLRRKNGYPIQYILKEREFMGLDFGVEEGVLIPRPDTETLVETVLQILHSKQKAVLHGLEIGCGSGVISISLLRYVQNLRMDAIDINPKALELTRKNAQKNQVSERLCIYASNLFEQVSKDSTFDFIVSNPPYIRTDDIVNLSREIREFEPREALDGRADGLYFYRRILEEGRNYLVNRGFVAVEIGWDQGQDLLFLSERYGYEQAQIIKDIAGQDRVVSMQRKSMETYLS